jgi:glycosyltransferase involved in cell wall biosynthesis
MNNLLISVIISTYNRCESLKDTLDSLLNQECNGSFDWEVIVVDNNSKDKTREVIDSYMPKFNGRLRYVFEPKQGLSYARNRGIKESEGEIIAFTEDDAIVDKEWLSNIYSTFMNYKCDVLFGKILLKWEGEPPRWLTKRFYGNLGYLDYGNKLFFVDSDRYEFFGGNLSIKKTVFQEI